jgi:hypothetical protein
MPHRSTVKARLCLILSSVVWFCVAVAGMGIMLQYQSSPGPNAHSSRLWPAESTLVRSSNHFTLVMLAHPQCPCSRASISELALLMTRLRSQVSAYVLFFKPSTASEQWLQTDLWANAARIPGVTVLADEDAIETQRFGARTSGQTFVYDPAGHLLFNGGITAGRGHPGNNTGRDAIISLASGKSARYSEHRVFGCLLMTPAKDQQNERLCCKR